jgi:hypothetical protein
VLFNRYERSFSMPTRKPSANTLPAHAMGVTLQCEAILHADWAALADHRPRVRFHRAESGAIICRTEEDRP